MTKIITLFNDKQKLTEAINTLVGAAIDKKEIQVIEQFDTQDDSSLPLNFNLAVMQPAAGQALGVVPTAVNKHPLQELGLSASAARFYQRGVDEGGSLIIVETSPTALPIVEEVLKKYSGQRLEKVIAS